MLAKAFIPYGGYWSSPFCRWQGSLADAHSVELAAGVGRQVLAAKGIAVQRFDAVILGMTVPQRHAFYGAPWLAAMLGAEGATGATIAQACATSARVLASAALEVEMGTKSCVLGVTCDRTSNGPHLYYPQPNAPGARGQAEDWVWDNFGFDPWAKNTMVETAERVASEAGFTRAQQDELSLARYAQYEAALTHDRAFQRRYMAAVTVGQGKRARVIEADEGIHPTTAEGLAKLQPAAAGGTVTYGSQTHPADGNAGIIVCNAALAAELSADAKVRVRVVSYGEGRVAKGLMPKAVVPAAREALARAGIGVADCAAVKTHNPFAVNDLLLCRELGLDPTKVNNYGSPLIYGHPQGPTGTRVLVELIEELVLLGGGYGLFTGCAAGDTAMAVVVAVS